MADEAYSIKRALNFLKSDPLIVLPFIFGSIITAVITLFASGTMAEVEAYLNVARQPAITAGAESFIFDWIIDAISDFFFIFAIFWQSFASADLVEKGKFSVGGSMSDAFASKLQILTISIFVSFVALIFLYIPFVGGYINALFTIVAFMAIISLNYNRKGLIRNITHMPVILNEYYEREPTTALFLALMMLVYIVPNEILKELVLLVLIIYGSLVLKLLN